MLLDRFLSNEPVLIVAVESPCAGHEGMNRQYARRCMRHAISKGETPFASHVLYAFSGVLDDRHTSDREAGIMMGFEIVKAACRYAVFYTDLGWSPGMIAAKRFYKTQKFPVECRTIMTKEDVAAFKRGYGVIE